MKRLLTTLFGLTFLATAAADPRAVATSINTFGLDLHRRLAGAGGNLVTSPWSIESALAMTWAGAAHQTKTEMQTVLRLPEDGAAVHAGFASLAADLEALAQKSRDRVKVARRSGGPATALEINTANRLFGDGGYPFEKRFLSLTEKSYGAPLEVLDFRKSPEAARLRINGWVASRTNDRIPELIPGGVIDRDTRLVLTNAIYLKAPWAEEFKEEPSVPIFVNGTQPVRVAGLVRESRFGYLEIPSGAAVTVPYADAGLQFVLFVPSSQDGLPALEKKLTPELLAKTAQAEGRDIQLHFPKFKLEPGRVMLSENLIAMGMPSAFNRPAGSADFSGIAPRKPDDYLYISQVIHQAFIAVDQHGTEAAAATAVVMSRAYSAMREKPKPLEIRVDRPFAFAIQHEASGACLFLGRVTDPR
jgi:serpin B